MSNSLVKRSFSRTLVQFFNTKNFACLTGFYKFTGVNLTLSTIKTRLLTVIALFLVYLSRAQSSPNLIGGRAMGMGYASSCLKDEWALFNNVAGLTGVEQSKAFFTYHAQPSFPSFNRMAGVIALPAGPGVAAVGIYRFGDDLYNEQILSAAYANTLGLASLGLKINYIQYHAEGFGNASALTVSFGGIAQLTSHLSVGAHIVNINQPKITKDNSERVPTLLTAGLGFKASDKLFITSEVEKNLSYTLNWKTGVEYKVHKKFSARTGVALYPQAGFLGLGWKTGKFILDYSFQYNMNLGASHQATAGYRFKPKR